MIRGRIWIAALPLVALGCFTLPAGVKLGPAGQQSSAIDRRAWVERVVIRDSTVHDRGMIEEALTTNLVDYIKDGGYFTAVAMRPGQPQGDDLVLAFTFDRYQLHRRIHPLNIPLGFLTMGFYYVCGGPVAVDTSDIEGELSVKSVADGKNVVARAALKEDKNISMWSREYGLPTASETRTRVVGELLDEIARQLRATPPAP